jgi:hypothetical protein
MTIPKRFALSTLLLLMLVVASIFGFAQYRRQWLKSEAAKLNEEDITLIDVTEHWFWPTPSETIYVLWRQDKDGNLLHDEAHTSVDEAESRFAELSRRLNAIGVNQVFPALAIERDDSGKTVLMIKPLTSLDELEQ